MPKKTSKAFPKQIFVYVCDYDEQGEPYYAVTTKVEDISEDEDGQRIARYKIEEVKRLKVERSLM